MAKKGNTTPDFITDEPAGEELKNDNGLQELQEMSKVNTAVFDSKGFDVAEPMDAETLVVNSSFFNWRDENDKPHIGKTFVGQYLGKHKNPNYEADPIGEKEILGYDFKGLDGNDYILGDNYSLEEALNLEKDGVKIMDRKPAPILWIRLIGVSKAKKGEFNQYKIKLMPVPDSQKVS